MGYHAWGRRARMSTRTRNAAARGIVSTQSSVGFAWGVLAEDGRMRTTGGVDRGGDRRRGQRTAVADVTRTGLFVRAALARTTSAPVAAISEVARGTRGLGSRISTSANATEPCYC